MSCLNRLFWPKKTKEPEVVKTLPPFYPKGSCTLDCNFPDMSTLLDGESKTSEAEYIGNTRWWTVVSKKKKAVSLTVWGLPKNPVTAKTDKWSIHAVISVNLPNRDYNEKPVAFAAKTFTAKEGGRCWSHTFDDVSENSGLLKDGALVFSVDVGITAIDGFFSGDFFDFSIHNSTKSDAILVVDGVKLHVSKQILSVHSPVFRTMFTSNFLEKNRFEIEIGDVNLTSFHLFLQHIYFAPITISDKNVCHLVEMADRFMVKRLMSDCQKFLIKRDIDDIIEVACAFNLGSLLGRKINEKSKSDQEKEPEDIASMVADYLSARNEQEDISV